MDGIGKAVAHGAAEPGSGAGGVEGFGKEELARLERQAEARYGAALVREMLEHVDEAQRQIGSHPPAGRAEGEVRDRRQDEDQVELSNQLRSRLEDSAWLEELKRLWVMLDGWAPDEAGTSLEEANDELEGLAAIYQKIMKLLAACTDAQAQEWMPRLESALMKAIQRFEVRYLREESAFFRRFGPQGTLDTVRASLYAQVAGRMPSPQRMHALWDDGVAQAPGSSHGGAHKKAYGEPIPVASTGPRPPARAGAPHLSVGGRDSGYLGDVSVNSEEGAREPAARIHGLPGYRPEHIRSQEREASCLPTHPMNAADGASASIASGKGPPFGRMEMLRTESFCHFMNGGEVSGQWEGLDGAEETAGCVAAMALLMGRSFARQDGIGLPMGNAVRSSVERMVDYYMGQLLDKDGAEGAVMRRKAYQVCYHILERNQEGETVRESMEGGLRLAVDLCGQREEGLRQEEKGSLVEASLRRRLRQCWSRYQQAVGLDGQDADFLSQSPWGAGMEGKAFWGSLPQKTMTLFGVAIAVAFLYLYLRGG